MKLPSWRSLSRKSVLLGVFLVEHTIPVFLYVFMMVSPVLKQTALKCVDVRLDSGFPFKSRQVKGQRVAKKGGGKRIAGGGVQKRFWGGVLRQIYGMLSTPLSFPTPLR